MVKLVDTRDLKSLAARRTGSIPVPGTTHQPPPVLAPAPMIIFDLACADEHRFEGWFRSADDFSAQQALRAGQLVQVLPGWKPVGAFAENLYALRPYAPYVPRAVTALVEHLRQALAGGFGEASKEA